MNFSYNLNHIMIITYILLITNICRVLNLLTCLYLLNKNKKIISNSTYWIKKYVVSKINNNAFWGKTEIIARFEKKNMDVVRFTYK